MNNLDKAFKHIDNNKFEVKNISFRGETIQLHLNSKHAFEAAKIAATPNWQYPLKNEFPEDMKKVWCKLFDGNYVLDEFIDDVEGGIKKRYKQIVEAWCYLPVFSKA